MTFSAFVKKPAYQAHLWKHQSRPTVTGRPRKGIVRVGWAAAILCLPTWAYALSISSRGETSGFLILGPLILAFNIALVFAVSNRRARERSLLISGLATKTLAVGLFMIVLAGVYEQADAVSYFDYGVRIAENPTSVIRPGGMSVERGTAFVRLLTAAVVILVGPSFPAVMLVFGVAAFWGSFFFVRAVNVALGVSASHATAPWLVLFPSVVFWTAAIGKDSLMYLFLGLFSYGVAGLSKRKGRFNLLVGGLGLSGIVMVRPHMAILTVLAFAIGFGFAVRGARGSLLVRRQVLALLILALGIALIPYTEEFLGLDDLTLASAGDYLRDRRNLTTAGGSSFRPTENPAVRLIQAPFVLIRPFPWEAHNLVAAIAGLEGLLLAFIIASRANQIRDSLRAAWSDPFVLGCLAYLLIFIAVFGASVGNFGTLARQRVMVLPLLFITLEWARVVSIRTRRPVRRETLRHRTMT